LFCAGISCIAFAFHRALRYLVAAVYAATTKGFESVVLKLVLLQDVKIVVAIVRNKNILVIAL